MGLMDIGSNNPYAIINPFAAVIDQGMKGWRTTSDRIAAEQKDAAAQAQQAQILEFARQDAERKQAAEVTRLNQLAKEQRASDAYAARTVPQYGFQQGPTEPMQAPVEGLMGGKGSMNPFQDPRLSAMMGPQPVANMGAVPQAPMTQQDMLNFRAQYAGTPTAEAVGQNAVLMAKENPNEFYQKLLASGKYTPESVVDFAAGKGKLAFAKDPSVVTWSEPFQANIGGKKALVQQSSTGQIKPVIEDKSTTIINRSGGGTDKADMYEKRAAFGELPKLRQEAQSASVVLPRLDRMQQILSSNNAGNTVAYLQQYLAPYAPEAKGANEAQLYQILARTISGPQRVNIIGPGAQTEKEMDVLRQVGGGGNQGRAALRELLNIHTTANRETINAYNGMIEAAGTKIYKPINVGQSTSSPKPSGKRPPLSQF